MGLVCKLKINSQFLLIKCDFGIKTVITKKSVVELYLFQTLQYVLFSSK